MNRHLPPPVTIKRVLLGLVTVVAAGGSIVIGVIAVVAFLFTAATAASDPAEQRLSAFMLLVTVSIISALVALWSLDLPGRGLRSRVMLTVICAVGTAICAIIILFAR